MSLMQRSALVIAIATIAACAKSEPAPADTKTRAQKDSAIANSGLPGSQGIANAMKAADSAKARQAALDSASKP